MVVPPHALVPVKDWVVVVVVVVVPIGLPHDGWLPVVVVVVAVLNDFSNQSDN